MQLGGAEAAAAAEAEEGRKGRQSWQARGAQREAECWRAKVVAKWWKGDKEWAGKEQLPQRDGGQLKLGR